MIRVLGVIPARLASTRLPRKVLRAIAGRPMLAWVVDAVSACPQLQQWVVAADSEEVMAVCRENGWPAVLTSSALASGSDRVFAISHLYPAQIYVNIQADEPLLRPEHLTALLEPFARAEVEVSTLKTRCAPENLTNPNVVKVVTAPDNRALYFSRATLPYQRDTNPAPPAQIWKHLGLYAYRLSALQRFQAAPPQPLELIEKLEQLRFLELGINIHVAETEYDTVGVDTEADLERAAELLREQKAFRPAADPQPGNNRNQGEQGSQPPLPRLSAALAAIWQRSQPEVIERLATLGMFGFPQGTELARQLEQQFELDQPDATTLGKLTHDLREAVFPGKKP